MEFFRVDVGPSLMQGGDNLNKRHKTVIKDEEQLKYRYLTTQRTDFLEQAILTNAKS